MKVTPNSLTERYWDVRDKYEVSPQQKRLFAIWQTDPSAVTYNIPIKLGITGSLNPEKLSDALTKLASRHESLRTYFKYDKDNIYQVIDDIPQSLLTYIVIPKIIETREFIKAFDLHKTPLFRALLVKSDKDKFELYLDFHHIIFDGLSLRIFIDELFDLYLGKDLKELNIQYKEAAAWANQLLNSTLLPDQEKYWLSVFKTPPEPINLPTDYKRDKLRSFQGNTLSFYLDTSTLNALVSLALSANSSLFGVMITTYAITLSQITGQTDIVIGCPTSGRMHPDLEQIIGMFVNTICIRVSINQKSTFTQLLSFVTNRYIEAINNQDYPLEHLIDKVGIQRDLSRNPLFDVMFALQNINFYEFHKGGLDISLDFLSFGISRFDINMQVYQKNGSLQVDIEYNSSLFKKESIEYLYAYFQKNLCTVIENPTLSIDHFIEKNNRSLNLDKNSLDFVF